MLQKRCVQKFNDRDSMNANSQKIKNIKQQLALSIYIAQASSSIAQSQTTDFEQIASKSFWVAEEIAAVDWRTAQKAFRDTEDIQQRWNERAARNRLKQSVKGLGHNSAEKKI